MAGKRNPEVAVDAKRIFSESAYVRKIAESFGIDDFVSGVISTLQYQTGPNHYLGCFDPLDFFAVFKDAVDRIDKYDGTPATLHLYIGNDNPFLDDLRLPSGQALDEVQIRFLFLETLRWFSHFPMSDEFKGGYGTYFAEWKETLESCGGTQDDSEALKSLSVGSEKNLTRLIYPILEITDFDHFRRQIQLLPNNRKRIEFAIEILADYDQTVGGGEDPFLDENGFRKNVRIEIEKLEKLIKLNDEEKSSSVKKPESVDSKVIFDDELDKQRTSDGKLEFRQIMVLLSEFIPEFANADNTKKGKFIAAISPYVAEKRIGDEFSYINNFAKEHEDMVKHWRRELKNTKRGRPRTNNYRKIGG